jgi:hypothetical protein
MQIEIEVPVVTWGYPKGSQTHKLVLASVPRSFKIPEYTASDLTVPFSFTQRLDDGEEQRTRRIEYYGLDGALYRSREVQLDTVQSRVMSFNRYKNRTGEIHPFFAVVATEICDRVERVRKDGYTLAKRRILPSEFAEHFDTYSLDDLTLPPLSSFDLRDLNEENVDEFLNGFSERMSRVIAVDGKIMFREQEPVFEVSSNFYSWTTDLNWRLRLRPETEPLLSPKYSRPVPIEFIPLSDYHHLSERIECLVERFGVEEPKKVVGDEILDLEINDASYLTGEAEAASMVATARLLRDQYIKKLGAPRSTDDDDAARAKMVKMVLDMNPADIELAQRLMTALEEADPFFAAERLEPVMEDSAARAAVGGVRGFGKDAMIEHAVDALERWHDREAGLNIAIAPSLRV